MEHSMMKLLITIVASYLLGNISPSYLIGMKYDHIDIRDYGSGNAGATNSLRVLGKKKALVVFLADALKGLVAARLGYMLGGEEMALIGAASVIVGHVFPIFLKFRGGKGVATTIGSLSSIFPMYGLICVLIGVALIFKTRYVSLGSMSGAVSMAVILWMTKAPPDVLWIVSMIALFILFTHRTNIKRLMSGTERKLGEKS